MKFSLLATTLLSFVISQTIFADVAPLTGKDLAQIVRTTSTEGADQQKYIGKRFADNVVFWGVQGKGQKAVLEVVSFDANLHPSYTESIYIDVPIEPNDQLDAMVKKGGLKRDDKLHIEGTIEDVVGDPTQEEPLRSRVLMKRGCMSKIGWN